MLYVLWKELCTVYCAYVVCRIQTSVGSFQGPDYCGDCKKFFTDLKIMLRDKTEQVKCVFVSEKFCIFRFLKQYFS